MELLKPCPCGGEVKIIDFGYLDACFEVICPQCGAKVSMFSTVADAVKTWNMRVDITWVKK